MRTVSGSKEMSEKRWLVVQPATETASEHQVGHLLGAIFSACPDAVLVVDHAGTIVLSNPAVTSLFGYYPEEVVGEPVNVLLPLGNRDRHLGHLRDFFAAPRARHMAVGRELAGRHRDGTEFAVEVSLTPVEVRAHTTPPLSCETAGNASAVSTACRRSTK